MRSSQDNNDEIAAFHKKLISIVSKSGQRSSQRRFPGKKTMREVQEFIHELESYRNEFPQCTDVILILSQAEEIRLDYEKAITHFNAYLDITCNRGKKKMMKKLVMLHESKKFWEQIQLSPFELDLLGKYLEEHYDPDGFTASKEWLLSHNKPIETTIAQWESIGLFNDFMILQYLVDV